MVGYDPKRDVELSKTEQGAAGALSGILTRTLIQPLDVLKIRFQLQIEPIRRGSLQSKYQSILQATRKIVTEEGVRALWKGHMPAQVLSVTYGGVQFVSFEFFTKEVWNELPSTLTTDYRPITHFMCGGLAGCISTLFCQPADVVRTRLIGQGEPKFYKTSWHAFSTLYAKEGFLAFYKGLLPAILTVFPQAALQFGFYTFFGQLLTSKNSSEIMPPKRKTTPYERPTTRRTAKGSLRSRSSSVIASTGQSSTATPSSTRLSPSEAASSSTSSQSQVPEPTASTSAAAPPAITSNTPLPQAPSPVSTDNNLIVNMVEKMMAKLDSVVERLAATHNQQNNNAIPGTSTQNIPAETATQSSDNRPFSSPTESGAMDSMTCGFCAGTCSKAVVYPLDVLKKRLQVQGFEEARKTFGEHRIYNGLRHCIKLIWKEEKLGGFYKGITPSLLKAGLSTGFSFFFYEQSCYLMRKRYRNDLDKYR